MGSKKVEILWLNIIRIIGLRNPVKCADYVPLDYGINKAKYQAQEAEKAKQETLSNLEKESQRICHWVVISVQTTLEIKSAWIQKQIRL